MVVSSLTECNVTAMVMALDYAGWVFPKGIYDQPEDNLCSFIFSNEEVLEEYKRAMPVLYKQFIDGEKDAYTPNEVHVILAFAANKWLGASKAVQFSDHRNISDIFDQIVNHNLPVIMSGSFPYKNSSGKDTILNHINVIVGLEYDGAYIYNPTPGDFLKISPLNVIIDDPYGDVYNNFGVSSNRNDIKIPYKDFIKWYKPVNDISCKMAHFITKPAAVSR
jgi:hypothetical protein